MIRDPCPVIVVDDRPLMAAALAAAVRGARGFRLAGRTGSAPEALRLAADAGACLLIVRLAETAATSQLLSRLRADVPEARALVLLDTVEGVPELAPLAAGAHGCLSPRATARDVHEALEVARRGESPVPPDVTAALLARYEQARVLADDDGLGRQERAAALAGRGFSDREIAAALGVSTRTVQRLLANARARAGLRRRWELATWAARHATQ